MFNYHSTPNVKPPSHGFMFLQDRVFLNVRTLKGGETGMYRKPTTFLLILKETSTDEISPR